MRYFLVCYHNGRQLGRSFIRNNQGKFMDLIWFELTNKCVVTYVFEFQNEQDWLDAGAKPTV